MSSNVSPNGRTFHTTDNPGTDRKSVTDSKADLVCSTYYKIVYPGKIFPDSKTKEGVSTGDL